MKHFLLGTAFAFGLAGPLLAQEDGAAAAQPTGPNWLVNCSNQATPEALSCAMSQSVVVVATGARLVTAIIAPVADGHEMSFILPFGLDLTAGVALSVDGAALQTLPVTTCDAEACYARAPLESAAIDAMRNGTSLEVGLRNVQDQPVDMGLTLTGFSAALDMMPAL